VARRGKYKFSSNTKALLTWRLAVLLSIMNNKQRKTLEAVFSKPAPKSLSWRDLESLFNGLGCITIEGDGSKVSFEKSEASVSFHRPHPQKEAKPYQIQAARAFLEEIGEKP
jgi:hypothetical protein